MSEILTAADVTVRFNERTILDGATLGIGERDLRVYEVSEARRT